jgi:hypothetical protein
MAAWHGLALVMLVSAAFENRPIAHGPGRLIASAAALSTATIVFTVTMLVPVDNRIAKIASKATMTPGSTIVTAGISSTAHESPYWSCPFFCSLRASYSRCAKSVSTSVLLNRKKAYRGLPFDFLFRSRAFDFAFPFLPERLGLE